MSNTTISRLKILELTVHEPPSPDMAWWISALLRAELIPLSPAILAGLRRTFPRIPKRLYLEQTP